MTKQWKKNEQLPPNSKKNSKVTNHIQTEIFNGTVRLI